MSLRCTRLLSRVSLRQYTTRLTPQLAQLYSYHHNKQSNKRSYGTLLVAGAWTGVIIAKAKEKAVEEEEEEDDGTTYSYTERVKNAMMKKLVTEESLREKEAEVHEIEVSIMEQRQKIQSDREEVKRQKCVEVDLRDISTEEYEELDNLYFTNRTWLLELKLLELDKVSPNNDEIFWRLARCYWDLGRQFDTVRRHSTFTEGFNYALKAIEINENNGNAHRWAAILSDLDAFRDSYKAQIMNLQRMRYHLSRAIEIDPMDQVSMTLMGSWHFLITEQTWYQRLFCSVFYYTLPTNASYDEALKYYLKSEQISDEPWKRTLLQLGKTYLKLGDDEKAVMYLKRVSSIVVVTIEDHYIGFKARYLLREIEYRNNTTSARRLFDRITEIPWTMNPFQHLQKGAYGKEEDLYY